MLADSVPAPGAPPGQPPMRKVALEEHYGHSLVLNPEGGDIDVAAQAAKEGLSADEFERMWHRLTEFEDQRLGHMDDAAIDISILSLNAPGIQGLPDDATAASVARQVNDYLAQEVISKHPERYAGFASIALQDAGEAASELERCVQQFGFKGAMINGYQNVDALDKGEYLDLPNLRRCGRR
jgi:2,3-dihydroxybenzoate decarboxylase